MFEGEYCVEDLTLLHKFGPGCDKLVRLKFMVEHLANDQFGNYVLQKILHIRIDAALKTRILEAIREMQASQILSVHGQRMASKLRGQHPRIFAQALAVNSVQDKRAKGKARNAAKTSGKQRACE